jgi:hypothetical protein
MDPSFSLFFRHFIQAGKRLVHPGASAALVADRELILRTLSVGKFSLLA